MHTKYIYLSLFAFLFSSLCAADGLKDYSKAEGAVIYLAKKPVERSLRFLLSPQDRGWYELNVPALISRIDRTVSAAGSQEFARLLQPISDTRELEARRAIVEILINKPELFEKLNSNVNLFASQYQNLITHFLDENARVGFLVDNTSPIFGKQSSLSQIAIQTFLTGLLIQNIGYEVRQAHRNWGDVVVGGNGALHRGWLGYNLLGQSLGIGYAGYYAATTGKSTLDRINEADKYVLQTAKALDLASQVENILKDSVLNQSEIAKAFATYHEPQVRSAEFAKGAAAAKDRLASEDSWLRQLSKFNSLDTYDNLRDSGADFVRMIQAFAILDAYLSVAKLHKEWSKEGAPVSLASFTESNDVHFSFEGLGNPLIQGAVTNNFALGSPLHARHGVITGPHGCGKTTVMRSAAYAFVLGQSILVVPARKAEFSPLTSLKTYFNVGDDILEGLSSFMSEHKRVADLAKAAARLKPNDRALFLVDEPYAKTIQTIGEPRVTDFMRKLSSTPGLSVVLATHFEEPSLLEAQTQGLVKNFQPELDEDLEPTYRIVDGAATWWFHDIEKRDRFIDKLIQ